MSILSRSLVSNRASRVSIFISSSHTIPVNKRYDFSLISRSDLSNSSHLQTLVCHRCRDSVSINSSRSHRWQIKVSESSGVVEENQGRFEFNFDCFLSLGELTFLVSLFVVSIGCLVNWALFKRNNLILVALGNRVLLWLLAGAVVAGIAIRRRLWRRICGIPVSSLRGARHNGNVIERIENLEENVRSAITIIRALSRQLEKLGIRFRVTRKTLRDPIEETAALARKNSEVTSTLASQEDRLEKELAEVQKVLLAMQDQQEKQLELILAIAKNGRLFEPKRETRQGPDAHECDDLKGKGLKK